MRGRDVGGRDVAPSPGSFMRLNRVEQRAEVKPEAQAKQVCSSGFACASGLKININNSDSHVTPSGHESRSFWLRWLDDLVHGFDFRPVEFLNGSRWPSDFDAVDLFVFAQAEVQRLG